MPESVFKYPLEMADYQLVQIPSPARVLSVIEQNDNLVLYAAVTTDNIPDWVYRNVAVYIKGTGHLLHRDARFIGTVKMTGVQSGLVWHVFYAYLE